MDDAGGVRYWMLETIGEYAGEKLAESADRAIVRARHADHFAALAHGAAQHMGGSSEKRDWVSRLDLEEANIRAALEHISDTRSPEALSELVVDLGRYWYLTARGREGHRWFAEVSDSVLGPELRVRVDAGYAIFASQHGEFENARRLAERSVDVWRTLSHRRGISDPLATLGGLALRESDIDLALVAFREGLKHARAENDLYWVAGSLVNISEAFVRCERLDDALQALVEAQTVARDLDDELWLLASNNRGSLHLLRGERDEALRVLVEGAVSALEAGYVRIALFPVIGISRIAVELDQFEEAALLLGASEPVAASGELSSSFERWVAVEAREALGRTMPPDVLVDALARGAALTRDELIVLVQSVGTPELDPTTVD